MVGIAELMLIPLDFMSASTCGIVTGPCLISNFKLSRILGFLSRNDLGSAMPGANPD